MLVHAVAQSFEGRVEVAIEDFGDSELARRFGVERYPAVFVDDVLIAKPKDFGFFGRGGSQGEGRYTPWLESESQARFRADLERTLDRALRGEFGAADGVSPNAEPVVASLPPLRVTDLDGSELDFAARGPQITLVEFWATWCPPCRTTLPWLSRLQEQHPSALRVVGVAVESEESAVRAVVRDDELAFPVVLATPELAVAFGDIVAVPTMFLFDSKGALLRVFHGAAPELHDDVESLVDQEIQR